MSAPDGSDVVQATVSVNVTMTVHFSQPFGKDWKLSDIQAHAVKDAEALARRWAADCSVGRAHVLKVDPEISLNMHVRKP